MVFGVRGFGVRERRVREGRGWGVWGEGGGEGKGVG